MDKVSPTAASLPQDLVPVPSSILDCRKIGRPYEYLATWKDLPTSENSWVPLSDLPTTMDEVVECFHRRHPNLPRPHHFDLIADRSVVSTAPSIFDDAPSSQDSRAAPTAAVPPPTQLPPSRPSPFVPVRPSSPPLPPRAAAYVPPAATTLRSGRVARPPVRLDPEVRTTRKARA
ncbi:hypothetical protein M422DRAFT_786144 [Sphaerobolus stellatus SS14]|uniref:Chromo domain-containing protein n=1 Tax=Sphaerobolus stellatus (strain SS14) TaxID=990650 RepID=A0A0C9TNS8_SPHS4|nr:hypothetical protein M422DRAFT_786144 [Sphaerobolus stellatus SS14]